MNFSISSFLLLSCISVDIMSEIALRCLSCSFGLVDCRSFISKFRIYTTLISSLCISSSSKSMSLSI